MKSRPTAPLFPPGTVEHNPRVEPGLPLALTQLSARQRTVVVLVLAYEVSQREAALLLGISRGSVQRHLDRGLARLRSELGVI